MASRFLKLGKALIVVCGSAMSAIYITSIAHGQISAGIATGVIASVFLNDIKNKANHIIEGAQSSGDFLVWRAAQQALALIAAWEQTNSKLIGEAFDRLDATTKQIFIDLDRSLDKIDRERELAVSDAQRLSLQWAQIIKSIPLVDHEAELFTYSPRVILPFGEPRVDIQVFGPRMAKSDAKLKDGSYDLPLKFSSEVEGRAEILRENLSFDKEHSGRKTIELQFTQKKSRSKSYSAKRELSIWLAPQELGAYKIKMTKNFDIPERKELAIRVGWQAKDREVGRPVNLPPDLVSAGWEIDIEKVINPRNGWVHDAGGDHGSCSYVDRNSISKTGFTYVIAFGHSTRGGRKRDAKQDCVLDVPMVRHIFEEKEIPAIEGKLTWQDTEVMIPNDIKSKRIEVKLFNGRTHIVADPGTTPLGLLSVEDRGASVLFRSKPPTDF